MPRPIYQVKAEYFKALGHPARIRILELLSDGERSAGSLVSDLQLEQSNVSQQLAVLRERGIIESRRDGVSIYYRIKDPRTVRLLLLAKAILMSNLSETNELLADLDGLHFELPKSASRRGRPRQTA